MDKPVTPDQWEAAALTVQAAALGTVALCGMCTEACDWKRLSTQDTEAIIGVLESIFALSENHTQN